MKLCGWNMFYVSCFKVDNAGRSAASIIAAAPKAAMTRIKVFALIRKKLKELFRGYGNCFSALRSRGIGDSKQDRVFSGRLEYMNRVSFLRLRAVPELPLYDLRIASSAIHAETHAERSLALRPAGFCAGIQHSRPNDDRLFAGVCLAGCGKRPQLHGKSPGF